MPGSSDSTIANSSNKAGEVAGQIVNGAVGSTATAGPSGIATLSSLLDQLDNYNPPDEQPPSYEEAVIGAHAFRQTQSSRRRNSYQHYRPQAVRRNSHHSSSPQAVRRNSPRSRSTRHAPRPIVLSASTSSSSSDSSSESDESDYEPQPISATARTQTGGSFTQRIASTISSWHGISFGPVIPNHNIYKPAFYSMQQAKDAFDSAKVAQEAVDIASIAVGNARRTLTDCREDIEDKQEDLQDAIQAQHDWEKELQIAKQSISRMKQSDIQQAQSGINRAKTKENALKEAIQNGNTRQLKAQLAVNSAKAAFEQAEEVAKEFLKKADQELSNASHIIDERIKKADKHMSAIQEAVHQANAKNNAKRLAVFSKPNVSNNDNAHKDADRAAKKAQEAYENMERLAVTFQKDKDQLESSLKDLEQDLSDLHYNA